MRLSLLLTAVIVFSILSGTSCTMEEPVTLMPVTTDSDLALEYYETGILAYDQIKFDVAYHNMEMAVKEDPDFFMAYFWMYFMSDKSAKKTAEKALMAEAELNEGEQEIRAAFKYLIDGQHDKVVEHLNKAIERYPGDPQIHKILYLLQFMWLKDYEGALESLHRAIEACPDYDQAYNQLGYVLMKMKDYEEAEKAFDTYIRLSPDIANPYDSKGDYFMNTGQYQEAYDSYMKAYEIDSGFVMSAKKAKKAMHLMEKSLTE
jgi:tetratricopeptide (TPR) repeat protein